MKTLKKITPDDMQDLRNRIKELLNILRNDNTPKK